MISLSLWASIPQDISVGGRIAAMDAVRKGERMTTPSPVAISTSPIAVVGNLNLDYRTSPILAGSEVMSDGETTVGEIYETLGGGGANTAVAAARLEGRVHLCACVGDDALGRRLEDNLVSMGIVARLGKKAQPTGRSIALTWDTHQRHFLSCLPSSAELSEADIDLASLWDAGCRHLYRADVWFAPRMLEGGNQRLLQSARSLGMETSLDINWDPMWSGDDAAAIAPRLAAVAGLLPHVTYAHGNEREICRFTGKQEIEQAVRWILDRGAGAVILHRGPRGCAAFTANGGDIEVPARPVERVVSETGTGDVFSAAFLLLPHLPLNQRLEMCAEVAARHLEGSVNLLPRLGEKSLRAESSPLAQYPFR
jgi:sugar/nucleoside kinase (ribokinase family)